MSLQKQSLMVNTKRFGTTKHYFNNHMKIKDVKVLFNLIILLTGKSNEMFQRKLIVRFEVRLV